jgi:glycerol-3-phosphate cytidylyltransferase
MINGKKVGFTASTFDLLHAGHISMLREAREHCDYLICALQNDPTLDRPTKNRPVQSVVERQLQLIGCKYVDEVWVYNTEKDLEDLLLVLPIDVRILGVEYEGKEFTGREICHKRSIELFFNGRDHSFSSSELRQRVAQAEDFKEKNKYQDPTGAIPDDSGGPSAK